MRLVKLLTKLLVKLSC